MNDVNPRPTSPRRPRTAPLFAILGLAVLLAAPAGLGHTILPLNVITNGGFDSGFSGWTKTCFAEPTCPGLSNMGTDMCEGMAALGARNRFSANFVQQTFGATQGILLDASFRVLANPGNPGPNSVGLVDAVGNVARITVANNRVSVFVFDNIAAPLNIPLVNPTDCHHIQVLLDYANKGALVFADGLFAGAVAGLATGPSSATRMFVGDISGYDTNPGAGPAPDVLWDGIYFGPLRG